MERTAGQKLISLLPYGPGFLLVDEIEELNASQIVGHYCFKSDWSVFEEHFPDHPVVPGVYLTECAAQIALATHGLYLTQAVERNMKEVQFALAEVQMDYLNPVYPNEKVIVKGNPIYFRFNKLKTRVVLTNSKGLVLARGTLSGMVVNRLKE